VIPTSHTWENGKNEISHQDPTFCEALMGEMSDTSRVLFPADWNSAIASLRGVYGTHGQIWTLVTPKRPLPEMLTAERAEHVVGAGALRLHHDEQAEVILTAIGGYQLVETLKASQRLSDAGVSHDVVYMIEPGRFREPRDAREAEMLADPQQFERLFPTSIGARVFVGHVRPESLAGIIRPLDTGPTGTRFMGYRNRGGTFDAFGMLYANQCTWGHIVAEAADVIGCGVDGLLDHEQLGAVEGRADPEALLSPGGEQMQTVRAE
jgi:phosphoketolase